MSNNSLHQASMEYYVNKLTGRGLLTASDVCRLLRFSYSTLNRKINNDEFPKSDLGRNGEIRKWKIETIENYINSQQ